MAREHYPEIRQYDLIAETEQYDLSNAARAWIPQVVQREMFLFNTQMQTTQDNGEIARLHSAVEDDNRIVELRRSVRMAAESRLENGVIDATDLLRKITDETTATTFAA